MDSTSIAILRLILAGAGLCLLGTMEHWMAYRPATVSRARRWGTNVTLAALNNLLLTLLVGAMVTGALAYNQTSGTGLLKLLPLPYWLGAVAFILIFDFVLYGLPADPQTPMAGLMGLLRMPLQTTDLRRSTR